MVDLSGSFHGTHPIAQPRRGIRHPAVRVPGTRLRYERVVALVEQLIEDGGLVPGDLLPSYTELADQAGVSLITVRRALDELERTGRIRRHQGLGTFVARARPAVGPAMAGSLLQVLVKDGRAAAFTTRPLALERGRPSADLCRALRIEATDQVWRLRGLRLLDGKPAVLETSVVPVQLAPTLDRRLGLLHGSLHDLLGAEYDLVAAHEEQCLEVAEASGEEAEPLDLAAGSQVVRIRGLSMSCADVPFDCFEKSYPASRFAIAISSSGRRQLLPAPERSDWRVQPLDGLTPAGHACASAP